MPPNVFNGYTVYLLYTIGVLLFFVNTKNEFFHIFLTHHYFFLFLLIAQWLQIAFFLHKL